MDLSKTFGGLNDELLITKLKFYGLDWNAVEFWKCYLKNGYQRCKRNNTLSSPEKTVGTVPQGSILGLYYSTHY